MAGPYEQNYFAALGPEVLPQDIIHVNRADDALYDELLSSCILHTNYLAASASNVIVEAVARNTPCIVNRHPAVVEYLGPAYPFYQDELHSAGELVDRARSANSYLRKIDKHQFNFDTFQCCPAFSAERLPAGLRSAIHASAVAIDTAVRAAD